MKATAGTLALVRLAWHRDRFALPAWVLALSAFTGATTALWANDLRDPVRMVEEAHIAATSPGIRVLGLISAPTVGAYAMVRDYVLIAVLAALMSIFAVVRHTRQGEETGRAELVGAAVVGRRAGLAAALVVTVAADAVLALALALALMLAGQPAAGSFTAGAAVAAVGVVFAGVAAVTSQLATSTRGASGLAAAALGLAFLFAGIGNAAGGVDASGTRVNSAWPAWLSPIGWGQQMRPFGGDDWWPLVPALVLFAGCAVTAAWLAARRDFAHGMLPQRAGRPGADRALRSPLGLAWRLQRGAFVGWAVGMLGFGLVMGGLIGQVEGASGAAREWYTRLGGSDQILDAYRASVMQMAAMGAAIYAVQVLLRMRGEEADGTLEPVLAAAVGRMRWVAGHAITALIGVTALLLAFAVGAGLTAGAVLGDPVGQVWTLIGAGAAQLPGVLVIAAAAVALIGMAPRAATGLAWLVLIASIVLGPLFGPTLGVPQWIQDLSPFTHAPRVPAVPVDTTAVLALVATVAVVTAAGLALLRRRDLALPA
jgi:ABC-2 type transport system permease protein